MRINQSLHIINPILHNHRTNRMHHDYRLPFTISTSLRNSLRKIIASLLREKVVPVSTLPVDVEVSLTGVRIDEDYAEVLVGECVFVFGEGKVKVETRLFEVERDDLFAVSGAKFYFMVWSVTRL